MFAFVGALVALVPASASAAISCTYDQTTDTANVSFSNPNVSVIIQPGPSSEIKVGFPPDAPFADCTGAGGPATMTNTDTISVVDGTTGSFSALSIAGVGQFVPGATAEAATSEIEFEIDFGSGADDLLFLFAGGEDNSIVAGVDGINTQGSLESSGIDADITGPAGVGAPSGMDVLGVSSGLGSDTVSSLGGFGTGNPTSVFTRFFGEGGNDALLASPQSVGAEFNGDSGHDMLVGGDAGDLLSGGEGDDTITGGLGDDAIFGNEQGGPSEAGDTASYDNVNALAGVGVNLTTGTSTGGQGEDTLTGIANVVGSPFADVLRGNELGNKLSGGGGSDKLVGKAGKDRFFGEGGTDKLIARDGTRDRRVDCGPGSNSSESARIDKRRPRDPKPRSC